MTSARLHLLLTFAWALLLVPTLIWWSDSILWVLIVSIYANVVSHWGAFEAAKAKEAAEENHP